MTVRWGILGCGEAAEVKSGPALSQVPGSAVTAVMRRDGAAARDFARRHGVARAYDDAAALIGDDEVDAIYLATPPNHHLGYALDVCAAGKPLLVERPMGRDADEARTMRDAFAAAGVPLFVAYYRRALPRFTLARRLIDEGLLGTLAAVQYRLSHPRLRWADPRRPEWRVRPEVCDGGFFTDFGCHVVDLIDYLAGPLLDVAGRTAPTTPGGLPGASVAMSFRTGSGALGTASWCFVTGVRDDCLDLIGTRGRMRLRMYWDHIVELDGDWGSRRLPAPDPEHVYEPFVRHVVAALAGRDDGTPWGTADAGVRAAHVMSGLMAEPAPGIAAEHRPLPSGPVLAGGR
jgi:1,5-anhydro-D-fructose reductase (1,5-anhydro-D-mannitol-forming)